MGVTEKCAYFAAKTAFDDLPSAVVEETKRLLLDTLGCAIGGIRTEKGEIALKLARALGGPADASLFGSCDKVSVVSSAFATGELMNALDYEALLSPPDHATPYVLAAPLAVGEMKRVSGRELIVSAAIAHELATRLGSSLVFGNRFAVKLPERGIAMSLPTPGYGLCAFGGAAAAGRLMGLDIEKITYAMGIAGYMAPVPMLPKFATTTPAPLPKYLSAGALSQQEVMAVLLAEAGSTGDPEALDGEYGFWKATGCEAWRPEFITEGLGKTWHFPSRLFYKKYPCCGAMQNTLAHFQDILDENDLRPEDIDALTVNLNALAELPVWRNPHIASHVDAQFNVPFVFSVLAHRVENGPSWQVKETLENTMVKEFMTKVRVVTNLDADSQGRPDVEVEVGKGAKKKVFSKEGYAGSLEMDNRALREKFRRNTLPILPEERVEKTMAVILGLEDLDDVGKLFQELH